MATRKPGKKSVKKSPAKKAAKKGSAKKPSWEARIACAIASVQSLQATAPDARLEAGRATKESMAAARSFPGILAFVTAYCALVSNTHVSEDTVLGDISNLRASDMVAKINDTYHRVAKVVLMLESAFDPKMTVDLFALSVRGDLANKGVTVSL